MSIFSRSKDKKPKKPSTGKVKKAAKAYVKLDKQMAKTLKGEGDKDKSKKIFLRNYGEVIDEYIENYANEKPANDDVRELIQDYFSYFNSKITLAMENARWDVEEVEGRIAGLPATKVSRKKKNQYEVKAFDFSGKLSEGLQKTEMSKNVVPEEQKEEASEGIRENAKQGLKDISMWALRNGVKDGGFTDPKTSFVMNYLIKQPARVKLLAFYLVESKNYRKLDDEDLTAAIEYSQKHYIPNLNKFKKIMIASKFKFWTRFDGGHIYWDKLGDCIRYAVSNVGEILKYGPDGTDGTTMPKPDSEDQQSKETEPSKTETEDNDDGKGNLRYLDKQRQIKLEHFTSVSKLVSELKKRSKKGEVTGTEIAGVTNAFASALEKLRESDKTYTKEYESLMNAKKILPPHAKQLDTDLTKIGGYVNMGGNAYAKLMKTESKMYTDEERPWYIFEKSELGSSILKNGSDTLQAVALCADMMYKVVDIINFAYDAHNLTAGEKILKSMSFISDFAGYAKTGTNIGMSFANVAKDTTTVVGGTFGVVTGSINVLTGTGEVINSALKTRSMNKAKEGIKEGKGYSLEEEQKAAKIARLSGRLENTKRVNSTVKAISGGLDIVGGTVSIVGGALSAGTATAIVGGVITAVKLGLKLSMLVFNYFRKKSNIKKTIDDYINMDGMFGLIAGNLNTNADAKEVKKNTNTIKGQLRTEAAGQLGYPSISSLYNGIVKEYAKHIYQHVFFKKGNGSDPITEKKDADKNYLKMMSGLGLKPNFKKRTPTIRRIAKTFDNV